MTKYLHFSGANTVFFLLNILGHDIFHDFGNEETRIRKAVNQLQSIHDTYGGGGNQQKDIMQKDFYTMRVAMK